MVPCYRRNRQEASLRLPTTTHFLHVSNLQNHAIVAAGFARGMRRAARMQPTVITSGLCENSSEGNYCMSKHQFYSVPFFRSGCLKALILPNDRVPEAS